MDYSVHDCLMTALAMMFFQDPSLLQFQMRLQEAANQDNLKTLFGVQYIPGEAQLRDVIDSCEPDQIHLPARILESTALSASDYRFPDLGKSSLLDYRPGQMESATLTRVELGQPIRY